jgi:hypothetical protein
MSYNGSGVFNINTAGQPVVTGTVISSTAFNALTADLATGLTTALTKDGQTTPTANIKLGGFKLTGIGVATTSGDALSYGQAATVSTLTNSALTSGRVTYATTGGLLTDSANLTFNGTTLTAGTIGGYTLSGTIAGGGNQINNVIIGTSTPLAGSFTSITGTSLQVSAATPVVTVTGTSTNASSQDFTSNGAAQRTTIGVERSTGGGLFIGSSAYAAVFGSAGASNCQFATSNNIRMSIDTSGIVTMNAYGAGAATFSASGVISSVSDETWKIKDGSPVNPDEMLKKLKPGYWYYNDEKKEIFGKDRQLGFYAQNVNESIGKEAAPIPETYIVKDEDGNEKSISKPWGYYDRSVLAVTVMSLQKALNTIEELTARLTALESK